MSRTAPYLDVGDVVHLTVAMSRDRIAPASSMTARVVDVMANDVLVDCPSGCSTLSVLLRMGWKIASCLPQVAVG